MRRSERSASRPCYDPSIVAIRVIFDGETFGPQEPVSLPARSEAIVLIEQDDPAAQAQLDAEVRAYYQSASSDTDDEAWGED